MFFNNVNQINEIASRSGTTIFVIPKSFSIKIKNSIVVEPNEKSVITIEQVRDVIAKLSVKQIIDTYVVIRPAELLNEEAANALLKSLEEPGEKVHFVLITDSPSALLPTILSRASIYLLRVIPQINIDADEKKRELAKRLMIAKGTEILEVVDEISRKKDGVRKYALEIIGLAIEMLYKSYFITGKMGFLAKLPRFLNLYDCIAKNGHIKLQIVANLC